MKKWLIEGPVLENMLESIVLNSIEKNVKFQSDSGLRPKVVRKSNGYCCEWCNKLVGTYSYPDVPKDVYRRHKNCTCTVEYDPGDGRRQNVWTKEWTTRQDRAIMAIRKNVGLDNRKSNGTKLITSDKQFGSKIGKHAADFGLDPSKEADREKMRAIIDDISNYPDSVRIGKWRGQQGECEFYIKGDDVVVANKGTFVTILKGGVDNERIKNARRKKI